MRIPIKDIDELKNVSFVEFKVIADKGKLFDYILNNDVYTYATLDDEIQSKVALPKGDFIMIQNEVKATIKIKNKVYYSSYFWTRTKDSEFITIGKAIKFDLKNKKINFKFKGTLLERIRDIQFYIDLMLNKEIFSINEVEIKMHINAETIKTIEEWKERLENLKSLKNKLEEFNINFTSDIDELQEQDKKSLFMFMDIFCKDKVSEDIKVKKTGLNCIKIGKYNIAVWCELKNNQLKFYNFFSDLKNIVQIVIVKSGEEPNTDNITSPYLMLGINDILKYSNFNASIVEKSFEVVKDFEKQSVHINRFILNLLQAYDKDNSREDILKLAETICNKLSLYQDDITNKLNKLQIIKRKRELTRSEKNDLMEIRQKLSQDELFNQNQCGIAILLDNQFDYEYFYNQMDEEEQKEFDNFPISNVIKNR